MKNFINQRVGFAIIALTAFVFLTSITASAQKKMRISATAMGTAQQLGRIITVDLWINEYSTAEDKTALLEAFKTHGSEGLANALDKMKSKGRVAITGTLGYDVNYIRQFKMPDGSTKIRFVTDRPITFGEVWGSTRSMDYQLSIGEMIISKEKGKTSGTIIPASMVKLDKEGHIEIEAYQNPWKLVNIKVW